MYAPPLPTTPARSLGRMAGLFRALADETRLGILVRLRDGEQCVCDLADALDAGQSRLSFHLKTLKDAGLLRDRRQGGGGGGARRARGARRVCPRVPAGGGATRRLNFFARTHQEFLMRGRGRTSMADDIKAIVKDRYGKAALRVVSGGGSGRGGASSAGGAGPRTPNPS